MYIALKHLHITLVAVSIIFFIVRFIWTTSQSAMLSKKWVKIVPHIIDTFLLLSAISLCVSLAQYPFVTPWLTDKFIGLLAYIVLGVIALKYAKTTVMRWIAFAGAISWVLFLVHVAITKQSLIHWSFQ